MKKVSFKEFQNELLNSLKLFQNQFENNGIFWWSHSGTTLGAIREKGIIPWDDDADMAMFNDEFYNNLDSINKIANDFDFTLFDPSKTWGLDVARLFSNETYIVEYNDEEYMTQIYIDINLAIPTKKPNKVKELWWEVVNKYSWIYGNFYFILPKIGWINGKLKKIGFLRNFLVFLAKVITFLFMFWVPIYQNKKVKSKKKSDTYQFFYSWNNKKTFYKKDSNFFKKVKFNDFEINIISESKEYLEIWYGINWNERPSIEKQIPHNLILTKYTGKEKYKIRPFLIK